MQGGFEYHLSQCRWHPLAKREDVCAASGKNENWTRTIHGQWHQNLVDGFHYFVGGMDVPLRRTVRKSCQRKIPRGAECEKNKGIRMRIGLPGHFGSGVGRRII